VSEREDVLSEEATTGGSDPIRSGVLLSYLEDRPRRRVFDVIRMVCTTARRGRPDKARQGPTNTTHLPLGGMLMLLCNGRTCGASFISQSRLRASRIVEPTSILSADHENLRLSRAAHPEPSVCREVHTVRIDLPLGIVIQDGDDESGVSVAGFSPGGNASIHNKNVFNKLKSTSDVRDSDATSAECVCIRDKLLSINGKPCHESNFDEVASLLSAEQSNSVTLRLGRVQGSTVVNFYDDGVCIAAQPGEHYGFLASNCGVHIDYQCRTGHCGTCLRYLDFPDKLYDMKEGETNIYQRSILNCVGKVPRSYAWLHVLKP